MSDRKKTIYIAGPMRGIKLYNFPAFDAAAEKLRAAGWTVINPADLDRAAGFDPEKYPKTHDWSTFPTLLNLVDVIRGDIEGVLKSDMLYMLVGWQASIGATAERAVARWAKKQIVYEDRSNEELVI